MRVYRTDAPLSRGRGNGVRTMNKKSYFTVHNIVLVGVLAAMVFALTYVGIDIPSPLGKCKIHFGNIMCLLSALLLGPVTGGLAAGIGSALFDLMDPAWAPEFWITFINKFAMAFVAGLLMRKLTVLPLQARTWVAAFCGSLTYSALYVTKNVLSGHFIKGFTWDAAILETVTVKLPVTFINGVLAVICAALLYLALRPALHKAHVLEE